MRGPQVSETHPISGDPIGVVPRRHIMYRLMTRPRMSGAVVSCTVWLAAVRTVSTHSPTGIVEAAKSQ